MKVKTIKIVIDCSKLPHYGEEGTGPDDSNMYEVHQLLARLAHDVYWADETPTTAGVYSITPLHHPNTGEVGTLTLEEAE